ncbi:MAG: HD domain-containing protein [Candidatus Diapherotrites archaeon]
MTNDKPALFAEVQRLFKGRVGAHGFDHVLRVCKYALEIAEEEKANKKIVEAMALLHDIVRYEGEKEEESVAETLDAAKSILERTGGYSAAEIRHILDGIKSHSLHSEIKSEPQTIEAKILFDADKMDSVGPIGIARWFTTMAPKGIPIGKSAEIYLRTIRSMEKKLGGKLYTKTATKKIKNLEYTKEFMKEVIRQI